MKKVVMTKRSMRMKKNESNNFDALLRDIVDEHWLEPRGVETHDLLQNRPAVLDEIIKSFQGAGLNFVYVVALPEGTMYLESSMLPAQDAGEDPVAVLDSLLRFVAEYGESLLRLFEEEKEGTETEEGESDAPSF